MKAWYQLAMHARVKFTIIIMHDVMTLVPYGKNKPATEPTLKLVRTLQYAIGIKLTTLSCEKVVTLPLNLGKIQSPHLTVAIVVSYVCITAEGRTFNSVGVLNH